MATKATQEVHVFVRDLGNGVKEAHVWPPVLFAAKSTGGPGSNGDTIDFINSTNDDILLVFPDVFTNVGDNRKQIAKGTKHSPQVIHTAPSGRQTYSIFCAETGSVAIGGSPPEVIIE